MTYSNFTLPETVRLPGLKAIERFNMG